MKLLRGEDQRSAGRACGQERLADCLSKLLGERTEVTGCGRTDTGVHATEFYAHFEYAGERDVQEVAFRLNRFLPKDIAVFGVFAVGEEDHTRASGCVWWFDGYLVVTEDAMGIKGEVG